MSYIDLHCDRLSSDTPSPLCTLQNLEAGGCEAQVFAVFVHPGREKDPLHAAMEQIDAFYRMTEQAPGRIAFAGTAAEHRRNREQGKISAILSLEDAGVCGGDSRALRMLLERGVRMLSLTWNQANALARPNDTAENRADTAPCLTEAGREALAIACSAGVLVDLSHLSDGGVYEVLAHTQVPVMASHSNARTVCPKVRNLTDPMIRAIANRGGVIGLNFYPPFLGGSKPDFFEESGFASKEAGLDAVCRHARHIARLGGVECLAIGSDFDGFAMPAVPESPAALPELAAALHRCGFCEREIDGIFGGNFLRLFAEVTGK